MNSLYENISLVEKEARRENSMNLVIDLKLSRRLYNLGYKFYKILPTNWRPPTDKELVFLIMLARSLSHLRNIQRLVIDGYLAEAAIISTSAIEISLQTRKIKTDGLRAAQYWLNNTSDRSCWPITGQQGLCRTLGLNKIEGHYKLLCTIKHMQSKSKHINLLENKGRRAITAGPITSADMLRQVLAYGNSSIGDVVKDVSEELSFVSQNYKTWKTKFGQLHGEMRCHYKQWVKTIKVK